MKDEVIKILIIEDDEDDYIITHDILSDIKDSSFEVKWVKDYDNALSEICGDNFDIALIDYRLGKNTGIELISDSNKKNCGIPMILLTGTGGSEIAFKAMKAGAMDYLVKGQIDPDSLERTIRYAIQRKSNEKVIKSLNEDLEKRVKERTSELEQSNKDLEKQIRERQRTENALRDSEAKTRMVLDATLGGRGLIGTGHIHEASFDNANIDHEFNSISNAFKYLLGLLKTRNIKRIYHGFKYHLTSNINEGYEKSMNYNSVDRFTIQILFWHLGLFVLLAFLNSYLKAADHFRTAFTYRTISIKEAWAGLFLALCVTFIPYFFKNKIKNHFHWRLLVTVALTLYSFLFIFASGGAVEMRFHFFIIMAYLAIYADWRLAWWVLGIAVFNYTFFDLLKSDWIRKDVSINTFAHGFPLFITAIFTSVLCQYHRHTTSALESARSILVNDLIERKATEKSLTKRDKQQVAIAKLGQKALIGSSLEELMDFTISSVTKTLGIKFGLIYQLMPHGKELILITGTSIKKDFLNSFKVKSDKTSQAGYTILCSKPIIINDLEKDSRVDMPQEIVEKYTLKSCISVVIHGPNRPYGVIEVFTQRDNKFSQEDVNFLQSISNILSIAIERKSGEDALLKSEERYRLMIENIHDYSIFTVNEQGFITNWNIGAERLYGYKVNEILGQHISTLYVDEEETQRSVEEVLDEAYEIGKSEEEGWRCKKNGRKFWVHSSTTILKDEKGGIIGFLNITRDLTERRKSLEDLKRSEERFRALVENGADGVALSSVSGKIIYAGPTTYRITGYTSEEFIGMNTFNLIHPDDVKRVEEVYAKLIENSSEPMRYEYRIKHKNGSWRWIESITTNLIDVPTVKGFVSNYRDITERKLAEEKIYDLAFFDQLTKLPNRSLFKERLNEVLFQAQRHNDKVAVMFIDLDKIKNINDSLGHNVGDMLLQEVAKRIMGCIGRKDMACRQGGDEFIILLPRIKDVSDATEVAQKIIDSISTTFQIQEYEIDITPSVGIALYPENTDDGEHLIMFADAAMYISKNKGGNSYQLYSSEVHTETLRRLFIQNNLRKALQNKEQELLVHLQPKVDIATGKIMGMESLIRWNRPGVGMISPAEFIPVAEETDLIIAIDEWILKSACIQNKKLQMLGFPKMVVSTNITARQFNSDVVSRVKEILQETKLEPQYLELEITESTIMQSSDTIIDVLKKLKKLGVQISIDDFGTGYSSLSYLRRLPIDTLKVDRSFIINVPEDLNDVAIVTAIISMAHSLHLKVVAEGVEDIEQIKFLKDLGCDQVQGYYYSKPLPFEDFMDYCKQKESESVMER